MLLSQVRYVAIGYYEPIKVSYCRSVFVTGLIGVMVSFALATRLAISS